MVLWSMGSCAPNTGLTTLNSNMVKVTKLSASAAVAANGSANITFDISSLSGKTIIGQCINKVSATDSINYITLMTFYSDNAVRVASSKAQTVTVYALFFYIG